MTPAASLHSASIRDALIVAHFHRDGLLRTDTMAVLSRMQERFDKILLVSTNLTDEERSKVPGQVEVIVRGNFGYDFFSYREGILQVQDAPGPWRITLMNTSFVVADPDKFTDEFIVRGVQGREFDCMGLTKSLEHHEHIQSFLLSFSPRVVEDPRFTAWWNDMVPLNERHAVILAYELGLSVAVASWGYALHAMYQPEGRYRRVNPTAYCYELLLERYGILKIELFRSNPCKVDLLPLINQARTNPRFLHVLQDGYRN